MKKILLFIILFSAIACAQLVRKTELADTASALRSAIALKLNITDTLSLSNRINTKLNITDTTNIRTFSDLKYFSAITYPDANTISFGGDAILLDPSTLKTNNGILTVIGGGGGLTQEQVENIIGDSLENLSLPINKLTEVQEYGPAITNGDGILFQNGVWTIKNIPNMISDSGLIYPTNVVKSGNTFYFRNANNDTLFTATDAVGEPGGGITSVSEDSAPVLGGNLDLGDYSIFNTTPTFTITVTEMSYLDGVTSPIQTQLNSKASNASLDSVKNKIDLKLFEDFTQYNADIPETTDLFIFQDVGLGGVPKRITFANLVDAIDDLIPGDQSIGTIETIDSIITAFWNNELGGGSGGANPDSLIWATNYSVDTKLAGKQNALGFTPENVTNKATNLTSPDNTRYPTTLAVSTALSGKQDVLGYTPENVLNKSTSTSLGTSNILYPSQNAVKTYIDQMMTDSIGYLRSLLSAGGEGGQGYMVSKVEMFTNDVIGDIPQPIRINSDLGDLLIITISGEKRFSEGTEYPIQLFYNDTVLVQSASIFLDIETRATTSTTLMASKIVYDSANVEIGLFQSGEGYWLYNQTATVITLKPIVGGGGGGMLPQDKEWLDKVVVYLELDTIPSLTSFTPVTDAEVSTLTPSNVIGVNDYDVSYFSIAGGEYRTKRGATWSNWSDTWQLLKAVDSAQVRLTSSGSFNTTVACTLTAGGQNQVFNVTTRAGGGGGGGDTYITDSLILVFDYTDLANGSVDGRGAGGGTNFWNDQIFGRWTYLNLHDTTRRPIKTADGVVFDGNDALENQSNDLDTLYGNLTIEAVVYLTDTTVTWGNIFGANDGSSINMHLRGNRLCVAGSNGTTTIRKDVYSSALLNTWTYIVGTYDGSSVKIYFNSAEQTQVSAYLAEAADPFFSISSAGSPLPAGSMIRYVAIRRGLALSEAQVTTNYESTKIRGFLP